MNHKHSTVCFVCNQSSLPVVCAYFIENVLGVLLCIPVSILILHAHCPEYFSAVPQGKFWDSRPTLKQVMTNLYRIF
jgi:hypothetical protein